MNRIGAVLHKGWLAAKQRAGIMLAGCVLFVLAFVAGVHLFFPVAAAQRWLIREVSARTPVTLRLEDSSMAPLLTFVWRQPTVYFDNQPLQPVLLDEIRLQPLWHTLMTGNPGVSVKAALWNGQLAMTVRRNGELAVQTEGLLFRDIPLDRDTLLRLSGTIARGDLRGSFPATANTENQFSLEMDNVTLSVMGTPLVLGRILAQGRGQGRNLRITSITASGGDIAAAGSGDALLGTAAAVERINLALTLRPAVAAPASVISLLDLAARRQSDGSYQMRLSGPPDSITVGQP